LCTVEAEKLVCELIGDEVAATPESPKLISCLAPNLAPQRFGNKAVICGRICEADIAPGTQRVPGIEKGSVVCTVCGGATRRRAGSSPEFSRERQELTRVNGNILRRS